MCMNCENACPEDVIKFTFLPNRRSAITRARHRAPHGARGGGRGRDVPAGRARRRLARRQLPLEGHPPAGRRRGARVPRALHPLRRVHEGLPEQRASSRRSSRPGIEGLWTPILIARIGYCEFSCVLCGQVCPTGAIQKITEKEKMGQGAAAHQDRHGVLRPRALPAVVDADAVHRLRRVLPDLAQGDLGRGGRRAGARQQARARRRSRRR